MHKAIANALGLAGIAVLALSIWGGMGLTRIGYTALENWSNAAPDTTQTVAGVNKALDTINAPCIGDQPCRGTLGVLNKTIVKAGDAIVTTQLQEQAITPHTLAAVDSLASIAPHVNPMLDTAKGGLSAATELTQEATATLQTVNSKAGPLLDAYTGAGNDLDAIIKENEPSLHATSVHLAGIATNFDGVTFDFSRVTHKAADDYVRPKTPWQRIGQVTLDTWDIAAFLGRHY